MGAALPTPGKGGTEQAIPARQRGRYPREVGIPRANHRSCDYAAWGVRDSFRGMGFMEIWATSSITFMNVSSGRRLEIDECRTSR